MEFEPSSEKNKGNQHLLIPMGSGTALSDYCLLLINLFMRQVKLFPITTSL